MLPVLTPDQCDRTGLWSGCRWSHAGRSEMVGRGLHRQEGAMGLECLHPALLLLEDHVQLQLEGSMSLSSRWIRPDYNLSCFAKPRGYCVPPAEVRAGLPVGVPGWGSEGLISVLRFLLSPPSPSSNKSKILLSWHLLFVQAETVLLSYYHPSLVSLANRSIMRLRSPNECKNLQRWNDKMEHR